MTWDLEKDTITDLFNWDGTILDLDETAKPNKNQQQKLISYPFILTESLPEIIRIIRKQLELKTLEFIDNTNEIPEITVELELMPNNTILASVIRPRSAFKFVEIANLLVAKNENEVNIDSELKRDIDLISFLEKDLPPAKLKDISIKILNYTTRREGSGTEEGNLELVVETQVTGYRNISDYLLQRINTNITPKTYSRFAVAYLLALDGSLNRKKKAEEINTILADDFNMMVRFRNDKVPQTHELRPKLDILPHITEDTRKQLGCGYADIARVEIDDIFYSFAEQKKVRPIKLKTPSLIVWKS